MQVCNFNGQVQITLSQAEADEMEHVLQQAAENGDEGVCKFAAELYAHLIKD